MYILSIETSCDETSLAILELEKFGDDIVKTLQNTKVVSQVISSQIDLHAKYGGVVPEIGAREHAEHIHVLFNEVLEQFIESELIDNLPIENENKKTPRQVHPKNQDFREPLKPATPQEGNLNSSTLERISVLSNELKYICVTTEPGLASALRVGHEFAKTLQYFLEVKFNTFVEIIKVNHLHGHLTSSFWQQNLNLNDSTVFPHLHLLVSGGNTQLIYLESYKDFKIVGQTLDDAAGESFDKIGRMVGLQYPGGVNLAKIAGLENMNISNLPISMLKSQDLNFSFSGLKTAVRYKVQATKFGNWKFEQSLTKDEVEKLRTKDLSSEYLQEIYNICVSGQSVIVSQLINKTKLALKKYKPKSLGLSGGVSANLLLRQELEKSSKLSNNCIFLACPKHLTGDNAVMIGLAGIAQLSSQKNNK